MKVKLAFVHRVLPVALFSIGVLVFSVNHLLNYPGRVSSEYTQPYSQDLGMPRPASNLIGDRGADEINMERNPEVLNGDAILDPMPMPDLPPERLHDIGEAGDNLSPQSVELPQRWHSSLAAADPSIVSRRTELHKSFAGISAASPVTPRARAVAMQTQAASDRSAAEDKIVLLWTTWFNLDMWWFKPGKVSFVEHRCPVQACYATNNRSYASKAHLVLFQASKVVYKIDKTRLGYDIPPNDRRPPEQIWGFATRESPLNTYSGEQLKPLDGLMNVTMTYKRDSDIVFPFSHQHLRRNKSLPRQKYGTHRKKLALWFVSNCRPRSKRLMLAQELQKHLGGRIDIFGKCSNRTNPCGRGYVGDCEKEVVPQYKFYLAFENSICRDYITEKFFHKLYKGALPIVYGTSQQDYAALAPPNSYLHVDNFTSVAALAAYMLKLDADDEAYDAYHRWREDYDVVTPYRTGSVWSDFACAACSLAHDGLPEARRGAPHKDLSSWFSPRDCKVVVERP